MRDLDRPPSSTSSASSDKYHVRMPGPTPERPRAQRLNDIEQHTTRGLGCGRTEDFGTPVSSGSNMGSVARFPKLDECAHFHYEHVELGALEVSVTEVPNDANYAVRVTSGDACWTLQRSYENFVMFDKQLHRCIFDRKFSSLAKLPDTQPPNVCELLVDYLERFSQLNHEGLNCGPVLNWLQLDNRGRRILVPESDSCPINTPAVAAAYAVRPYAAQAQDEISFQVGDMISVIDMPPPGESTWWRGKHGFAVGFFPAECVAVIGDKVPRHLTVSTTVRSRLPVKPVLRKHGKLIAFFRSFILNRPSRRRLKQSGILKERVFGCDLGEHLLNSGQDVPAVLTCCAEFIENHGLVDGIYRLSGVTSNIQRLRHAFDEDRVPALHSDEGILQDIHSVASLLKMYFRELPNPLCTYQLYSTFVGAVQANSDSERLRRMRDAVRKLPPPHYRTLEYLMRHLVRVAARGSETGMTPRNVAIVWAPNLLRCKELEVGGVAALQGVGVQAVVTEFLVCYAELIFGDGPVGRPKSLAITTPARLLSLEEARNRSLRCESDYIEVGAGPAGLPLHYHTVIELPRKRNSSKRSPSLNWRAIFGRGGFGARGKTARQVGTPPQAETMPNSLNSLRRLRPVKSADSLDGEDSLGPLLGPPPARPCGHSRSVSHDSYFDHLADAPNPSSPLDLSEIQLNFDLEEREMRMFSEEESAGIASVEASPRRQRNEDDPPCITVTGGSKRKRSRLEERLHCEVELRFIDSQSPDQVMQVSADIHGMETPSPLPTPGYLPLLSEASTPMTPATMQSTPLSISPGPSNSPRISFRSFTLPLDLDESCGDSIDETAKRRSTANPSSKSSQDPSQRSSTSSDGPTNINKESRRERIDTYGDADDDEEEEQEEDDENEDIRRGAILDQSSETIRSLEGDDEIREENIEARDEEMIIFCKSNDRDERKSLRNARVLRDGESSRENAADDEESRRETERSEILTIDVSSNSQNGDNNPGDGSARNEPSRVQSSSNTDLDSPMSCEHTLEDLPDSGFVICDNSDKMFTSTEGTQGLATNTNDSGEWVMVERTTESVTTPTSDPPSPKNLLDETTNKALAEDPSRPRSAADDASRTSLDLTMCSNVDTDVSCIGASVLTESSSLLQQQQQQKMPHEADEQEKDNESIIDEDSNVMPEVNEIYAIDEKKYGSDKRNGNESSADRHDNQRTSRMEQEDDVSSCYDLRLDNETIYHRNLNDKSDEETVPRDEENVNEDKTMQSPDQRKKQQQQQQQQHGSSKKQQIGQYISCTEQQRRANETRSENQQQQQRYDQSFAQSPRKHNSLANHHHHHHNHHHHHPHHHHHHHHLKYIPKHIQESVKRNNMQNSQTRDSEDVVIASESAAEPREYAHKPEGASETTSSLDSSCTASEPSSPIDDSVVLRDTAAILQELALQRLSGGVGSETPLKTRRRYDTEAPMTNERRSFDSEIGREIVRERKIRQELDNARGRSEEPPANGMQYLPPCLRARHARSTRAALSRSLDEGKFNRMTKDSSLPAKQSAEDNSQHNSTPNVGTELSMSSASSAEKLQSRNLGGLDLGDPRCRERIEKYKEERRMFLRDKYRSESFRGTTSRAEDDNEQALLARLKQRASRPSLH